MIGLHQECLPVLKLVVVLTTLLVLFLTPIGAILTLLGVSFNTDCCLPISVKITRFSVVLRPGRKKNRQNGKLLAGKFCDSEGKIKKYIRETLPHWREIYTAGGKFCPACRKKNPYFQAWLLSQP